ncbi:helix-turn-helix domain-containing protein [Aliamphritea spongicola]|nr:helix-turn-helix domain-containing protein [Aliamphritea spongicola]
MLPAPLDGMAGISAAQPRTVTPPPVAPVSPAAVQPATGSYTPAASFSPPPQQAPGNSSDLSQLIRPIAELEREAIERAIDLCQGNIPKAAHYLEISAATIYRKRNSWKE